MTSVATTQNLKGEIHLCHLQMDLCHLQWKKFASKATTKNIMPFVQCCSSSFLLHNLCDVILKMAIVANDTNDDNNNSFPLSPFHYNRISPLMI